MRLKHFHSTFEPLIRVSLHGWSIWSDSLIGAQGWLIYTFYIRLFSLFLCFSRNRRLNLGEKAQFRAQSWWVNSLLGWNFGFFMLQGFSRLVDFWNYWFRLKFLRLETLGMRWDFLLFSDDCLLSVRRLHWDLIVFSELVYDCVDPFPLPHGYLKAR